MFVLLNYLTHKCFVGWGIGVGFELAIDHEVLRTVDFLLLFLIELVNHLAKVLFLLILCELSLTFALLLFGILT